MFSQILRRGQCAILLLLLAVAPAAAQNRDEGDFFIPVDDYPWVGYIGPLGDGLHGLLFGMGAFDVNAVMREKGLEPANARAYTLRFEGEVMGRSAELLAEFNRSRPSETDAQLRVVQIRWLFKGLPQEGYGYFQRLEKMLETRYGRPVMIEDRGEQNLDTGEGQLQRLFYGYQAMALLQYKAIRQQEYGLIIRIECPQLPKPIEEN